MDAVKRLVALVHRLRAAHAGADEHAGALAIEAVGPEHVGRLRRVDRLARRQQRHQAEAVEHAQLWRVEVQGAVDLRRGRQRCRQAVRKGPLEALNARAPGMRLPVQFGGAVAERRDHADGADRDPPHGTRHADASGAPAVAAAAMRASIRLSM